METMTYELLGNIPHSEMTGIDFVRIEMLRNERSPLAVVWYRMKGGTEERGARIDLDKQVFLDDFGSFERAALNAEAQLIVHFVHLHVTARGTAAPHTRSSFC
jgi:hypothetical protein